MSAKLGEVGEADVSELRKEYDGGFSKSGFSFWTCFRQNPSEFAETFSFLLEFLCFLKCFIQFLKNFTSFSVEQAPLYLKYFEFLYATLMFNSQFSLGFNEKYLKHTKTLRICLNFEGVFEFFHS